VPPTTTKNKKKENVCLSILSSTKMQQYTLYLFKGEGVPFLGKMEYLVFPTEYNYDLERLYGTAL